MHNGDGNDVHLKLQLVLIRNGGNFVDMPVLKLQLKWIAKKIGKYCQRATV